MESKLDELLQNAEQLINDYKELKIGTEFVPRGILHSEAFFIYASSYPHVPEQIIESGRAQGQSTYLLSKIFRQAPILSVEQERDHPDAKIALDKLSPISNVSCLFGDSMKVIPEIIQKGDILVIDGPKDLNALLLIIAICRKKLPEYVFVHDAYKGSILRKYLQKKKLDTIYSDEPKFLQSYCSLDDWKKEEELQFWRNPKNYPAERVYGGTFACLSSDSLSFNFLDLISIYISKVLNNFKRSARKRLGTDYMMRHPCE